MISSDINRATVIVDAVVGANGQSASALRRIIVDVHVGKRRWMHIRVQGVRSRMRQGGVAVVVMGGSSIGNLVDVGAVAVAEGVLQQTR